MKRYLLLSVLFFLLSSTTFLSAQQNDSLRNEILNYPNSDMELISKGRALTIEYLKKGDLPALKEVKEYLAHEVGGPYKAYLPVEYWLLSFWTEDYGVLLNEAKLLSSDIDLETGYFKFPENYHPSPLLNMLSEHDQLSYEVAKKSAESYTPLSVSIDAAQLNDEEKEFLKMWLYSILFSPTNMGDEAGMEEINKMADNFINTYKNSEYNAYTRRFIRYRLRRSNWGYGYELFLGYNAFSGDLSRQFTNNMAGGFAFNVLYRDFELSLRFNYTSAEAKKEITNKGVTWPAGIRGSLVGADLALHYPIYQNRNIKLQPFIGIGGMGISPTEQEIKKDPELENFKELSTFNYLAGIELKLNSWSPGVDFTRNGGGYLGLRYTYYMPNYGSKYDMLGGNMHMITLSFGGFFRPMNRTF